MSEWKKCKLGDLANYVTGKLNSNAAVPDGSYPFFTCSPETLRIDNYAFDMEALILAGNNADGVFSLKYYAGKFNAYQRTYIITIIDEKVTDYKYLFYSVKTQLSNLETISHGTATKYLTLPILNDIPIRLPSLPEQRAIAGVLSSLDDKTDLLHRQNKTLEGMAEGLWRKMFVEEADPGWDERGLDEIATFLNGLPCQKFPPDTSTEPLPVIKIKELRTGITDDTDLATAKVPPEYIIDDGDILFSWSGSLEVIIWSFGKGVLNQHLFKVTSVDYPKWFFYYWIKHHLAEFRDIAQDKATTMGHIQRHHLSAAKVLIPDEKVFEWLNIVISPVFEKMMHNLISIRKLTRMRDTLLPKLMSGEVRVKL